MHFLIAAEYTALAGEINALYHEAAVKAGISDSVQNILYVLYEENGRAPQSAIAHRTGISRQTINSAIRKLDATALSPLNREKGGTPSSVSPKRASVSPKKKSRRSFPSKTRSGANGQKTNSANTLDSQKNTVTRSGDT